MVKQLTGAQVMAMAEDVPSAEGDQAGRQGTSDRQDHSRRRHGDARRHDAGRASDARPYARLHDVDDRRCATAARTTTWCSTAACVRRGTSRRRIVDRVQPFVQGRARAAVRRAAGRSPGAVQHAGEVREAGGRRSESVHRQGELQPRNGHPGSDVPAPRSPSSSSREKRNKIS